VSALDGELTIRSAARVLGIDRETLTRWIDEGHVASFRRTPTGRVFIPRAEVERLQNSHAKRDRRSSQSSRKEVAPPRKSSTHPTTQPIFTCVGTSPGGERLASLLAIDPEAQAAIRLLHARGYTADEIAAALRKLEARGRG